MEDTLRGTRNDHQEERHRVLILILMEDTLREGKGNQVEKNIGLS